jgi:penicillin-binding protein 1A
MSVAARPIIVHNPERMPYRPKRRRVSPSGRGNGTGGHRRGSTATRVALSRRKARKPGSGGPSALLALALVFVVLGGTIASAGVIAAGSAAGVTIASLDEGLPDVRAFRDLDFSEPTKIVDRSGKNTLAEFWDHRRRVVKFEEIPPLVLDVTTAVEDDTFWDNPGFDFEATVNAFAQTASGGDSRGASTITQQLVRARLLPKDVTDNDNTQEGLYVRKAKELIQSFKLTQAFPGEEGKKDIITAYLNEIFYGQADGIAAAAKVYFDKELNELTVSEAALLAGIPQNPVRFDLFKNSKNERYGKKRKGRRKSRIVVPSCGSEPAEGCTDSDIITRRNFILRRLRDGKGRFTTLSQQQYEDALNEKITLQKPKPIRYKAPHFVFALLPELQLILGDREPIQRGGYTVITTLDMKAQRLGERVIAGGAVLPNLPSAQYYKQLKKLKLRSNAGWINRLRGANLRNGALVAQDYRTGDILAYVGSAGYYRKKTQRFSPKTDHVGGSHRQPGSAWKPILYATGIDTERLTAGTFLLDQREQFGPGWTPQNADRTYSGLIQVRDAIQKSLNIPAIRALQRVGASTVRKYAVKAGFTFLGGNNRMLDQASLAGALGTVEVRPLDMTTAFGAFGNAGKVTQPRYILKVLSSDGEVIYEAGKPITKQVWRPATAYIMADILSGNTNRAVNPAWGAVFELRNTRDGSRRVAAVKTGTTNQLKDYSTYGILPIPKGKKQPALAVGVWYGNSDSSSPSLGLQRFSLDNAGQTWAAFVRQYMRGKPAPKFKRPKSVVTGSSYGGGGTEIYLQGTQPGGKRQVDRTVPKPTVTAAPKASTTRKPSAGSGGGGGGGGGGNKPAPTCRPGFTNKPPGCTVSAPSE